MDRFLQLFREYPAVVGIGIFLLISVGLGIFLGSLMHRAGASLKPLLFFFGFLAIVVGPQGAVHLLDALAHRRAVTAHAGSPPAAPPPEIHRVAGIPPVAWEQIFGPGADPSLITDARRGLATILGDATDAKLSFSATGESALAARFETTAAAAAALNRYGTFFQFAQATGSDAAGWTARRNQGQREWNHVVTAGSELYAWTGPTREVVVAQRTRALGPLDPKAGSAEGSSGVSKTQVSTRLTQNVPVMTVFLVINVLLAVGWFFKASAWATRVAPAPTPAADLATVRARVLAVNQSTTPVAVKTGDDGKSLEITWRYFDARWFDLMRLHGMRRTHKLVLDLDADAHKARVREYWSALDTSAGLGGMRFQWQAATGMQFFQLEHQRVVGVQLGSNGRPTGELSAAYTFNLQELKSPIIKALTESGWTWQPVMWSAPPALRWLTE